MNSSEGNRNEEDVIIVSMKRWKKKIVKDFMDLRLPKEQKSTLFQVPPCTVGGKKKYN